MTTTSALPSALSFPPATFAKLSPAPYLLAHLKPTSSSTPPTRPSGRSPSQFRTPTINTSSLSHAYGSAVVRTGDTAVVCGIRPEILLTSSIPHPYRRINGLSPSSEAASSTQEIEELGLLVPNLELSTGCSPAHLPGNAPSTLAQSLTQRVLSLLHSSNVVDADDLRIQYTEPDEDPEVPDAEPRVVTKAYWALYIDILFISLDGNPFDAAWAAVLAALNDTKLPKAWWDADREMVVCEDKASEAKRMSLRGLPVAATFAVFSAGGARNRTKEAESWVLADPDGFEHDLCDESVTVVVDAGKKILRIEKNGGGVVGREKIREIVGQAEKRWEDWHAVIVRDQK